MTTEATRALCIDAERLAAWADHGLPADEAAAVELHLSRCARCQEVLAAFARSAPVAAVVIPFWARRPVQWTAGLAAAAALVFAVWTQQGERQRGQLAADVVLPESTVASNLQAVAPAAQPPAAPEQPSPVGRTGARGTNRTKEPQEPKERQEPRAAPPPPKPTPPPPAFTAPPVTVAAAPPAIPPVVTTPVAVPPSMTMQIPTPAPIMALREASDAFAAVPMGIIEILAPSLETAALRDATDLRARGAGRGGGGGAGRGGAAGGVTSGGAGGGAARPQSSIPTRWRIINRARIERSTDAGVTWMPVVVDPPVATALTAGAATSQTVCWIVGRDGVVLVAADGTTFRRVSIPEVADLVGVTPESALRAIVTTADGRVFATTDAGATWRLR